MKSAVEKMPAKNARANNALLPEHAIWLVSLRPGVPLRTEPVDVDLPGMPRGFYTMLEGHPREDGGWDIELVSAEHFTWH
jgi:hypothetical protein